MIEKPTLLRETIEAWLKDGGPQWSAAVAYYSMISLAPLLLLATILSGLAFERASTAAIHDQLEMLLGPRVSDLAMTVMEDSGLPEGNVIGLIGHVLLLLVGATIVFANVRGALNKIWGLRWARGGMVRGLFRQRMLSFAMIVVTGLIMLASLGLTAVADLMSTQVAEAVGGAIWVSLIDGAVTIAVLSILFAATFRILPDGDVWWRDVALGAVATAVLFVIGKMVVSAYLTRASVVGAYGVSGAVVFFLIWIYYSAAIFFFGAEFTQVWASRRGRPIVPYEGAVRTELRVVEKTARDEDPAAETATPPIDPVRRL